MSKPLAVVSLDSCLWQPNLAMEVAFRMQEQGFIPAEMPLRNETEALDRIADPGVAKRPKQLVQDIGRGAANACLEHLNDKTVNDVTKLSEHGFDLIAASSAPDFAVHTAVRKLRRETTVNFGSSISAEFTQTHGVYLRGYQPAARLETLKHILRNRQADAVDVALVNKRERDMRWVKTLCKRVFVVDY